MKKIICVIITMVVLISCFFVNQVSAFGGYTHFFMSAIIAVESLESENTMKAYISGNLIADIGKSTWDNEYNISSDSYRFMNKVYELAHTEGYSSYARASAYGWRDHYIQDTYGKVANMNPPGIFFGNYSLACGWVDEYLRDEIEGVEVNYPIQDFVAEDPSEIYVPYYLIQSAYEELCGYRPSRSEILEEIEDMCALYDLQIAANMLGWSNEQIDAIIDEMIRVMDLCPGITPMAPSEISGLSVISGGEISETKRQNNAFDYDLSSLTDNYVIEEVAISESESFITIKILNTNNYGEALAEYVGQN